MKKFKQFITEDPKLVSNNTKSSIVYSGSKHDVLKKSKHKNSYSEKEFQIHEMMKKRPDLFCKIIKNSKEQVLMEKLDTTKFEKYYNEVLNSIDNSNYKNYQKFLMENSDFNKIKEDYKYYIKSELYKTNKELYFNLYHSNDGFFEFIKSFIELKLEIYDYFKNWISNINQSDYMAILDLHDGNFGFIKGTQEIRCFDPIYIKKLTNDFTKVNRIKFSINHYSPK